MKYRGLCGYVFVLCPPILSEAPITHILPGGRDKSQSELIDEMAQELVNVPRVTAYAKIIGERDGEQRVWKGKIKTIKGRELGEMNLCYGINKKAAENHACLYGKKRSEIENELQRRR